VSSVKVVEQSVGTDVDSFKVEHAACLPVLHDHAAMSPQDKCPRGIYNFLTKLVVRSLNNYQHYYNKTNKCCPVIKTNRVSTSVVSG